MTVEELIEELQKFPPHYIVVFDVIGDNDTECDFLAEQGILNIKLDIEPSNSVWDDCQDSNMNDSEGLAEK